MYTNDDAAAHREHRAGLTTTWFIAKRCVTACTLAAILTATLFGCGSSSSNQPDQSSVSNMDEAIDRIVTRNKGERYASSMSEYIDQQLDKIDANQELKKVDIDGTATARKKEILERAKRTGAISTADYESIWADYKQCMLDLGVTVNAIKLSNGTYAHGPYEFKEGTPADEEDMMRCGILYTLYIDDTYKMQQDNPNLFKNSYEGSLDCMHRKNLVPKEYSLEDLKHDMFEASSQQDLIVDIYRSDIAACITANGITIGGIH